MQEDMDRLADLDVRISKLEKDFKRLREAIDNTGRDIKRQMGNRGVPK